MIAGRSRGTVIGARRRVDVALPAAAPIGEYSAGLASMCGQDSQRAMPPAWSLAVAGAAPPPLSASPAESGVVHRQVPYPCALAPGRRGGIARPGIPQLTPGAAG